MKNSTSFSLFTLSFGGSSNQLVDGKEPTPALSWKFVMEAWTASHGGVEEEMELAN